MKPNNMQTANIIFGNGPYIRFGYIPKSERSNICKDMNCSDSIIGQEQGVSCYECLKVDEKFRIIYPPFNSLWDKSALNLNILIKRFIDNETKCFLINGNVVGRGTDNEPLLRDIQVIKELFINDFIYDYKVL